MTKAQLIGKIYRAFEGVALEDGVGLWEGQALDDYLQGDAYEVLKAKDERSDWQKISIVTLYKCNSSLSFFDAKGMRFHLGLYLLFALDVFMDEEEELHEDKNFKHSPPEVYFALTYELESDYSKNRFALLSAKQVECVIDFLEYNKVENERHFVKYMIKPKPSSIQKSGELLNAIAFWKGRMLIG